MSKNETMETERLMEIGEDERDSEITSRFVETFGLRLVSQSLKFRSLLISSLNNLTVSSSPSPSLFLQPSPNLQS